VGLVGTAVVAVVLYGLLLVLLVLLAWWATVALVCRIGRQLFPVRRSPGSGQPVAGASVLDAWEADRAGASATSRHGRFD